MSLLVKRGPPSDVSFATLDVVLAVVTSVCELYPELVALVSGTSEPLSTEIEGLANVELLAVLVVGLIVVGPETSIELPGSLLAVAEFDSLGLNEVDNIELVVPSLA